MFKSAIIFMAMAGSVSAADSFNVKLKFLRQGLDIYTPEGIFAPAEDDNLGNRCDSFDTNYLSCLNMFQCEQYDRSIDVFSDTIEFSGLEDVTIDTTAPYAMYVTGNNEVRLVVGKAGGDMWRAQLCTGYNGFQSTDCDSVANVPPAIHGNYWSGGSNPGTGNVGWGTCTKCSSCYVSSDMFGEMSCDYLCDGVDYNDPNIYLAISAGTNAKRGVLVGLLGFALTSLSLFVVA